MAKNNTYQKVLDRIATNLKAYRKDNQLTIRQVADICQMEENNYARFEKGQTNPTIKSLVRISKALGVDINNLLD